MNEKHDVHGLCLEVFAGISAIVTHDLKNTLAIINENAGLLDDLAGMAGEDAGVPTERVQAAAAKIEQQVTRSNTIIKNLNCFAHSGDIPVARTAVGEMLNMMVALTARKAAARNISVAVEGGGEHQVEASLFHLEALIYRILVYLYTTAVAGKAIAVSASREAAALVIRFTADFDGTSGQVPFPGSREQALLDYLGAGMEVGETAVLLKIINRAGE